MTQIIREITQAAEQESDGIGLVSQAVGKLDQMTQQNAALVEESAAAAEHLKSQAETLAEVVRRFRLRQGADGGSVTLQAVDASGNVAMEASATLA